MTNFLRILKSKLNENHGILLLGIFLLFLAIASPWFNLSVSNHSIVKSYFASFGISTLLFLVLLNNCRNSDVTLKINYIKLSLISLFIFGTLSISWSVNFDLAVGKWLLWVISAFSFLFALNLSINYGSSIKIAWSLTIAAFAIAIIGLLQYYFNPFSLREATTIASTFGNKNIATEVLVLIFPLSIFLLFSSKVQGIKVWILLGIISLIITYVIFTSTRAAWIAISVELFCIALYFIIKRSEIIHWINWNKNKKNAIIVALIVTLTLLNINPYDDPNSFNDTSQQPEYEITSPQDHNASASSVYLRIQIWQVGIKMILDSPLIGTGLGSFSQNIGNEGYASWIINNTLRAHNDLIELAVELGLIGIAFFLIVAVSLIISVNGILKRTNGEIHLFFFFIFTSLLGSFINLQFSSPYQMAFPLVLFGLYAGLIAKQADATSAPLKIIIFSVKLIHKKVILLISFILIFIIYFFTYFQWILAYEQLDKISITEDFSQLDVIETPVYELGMQSILYSLGGKYFKKGRYNTSRIIDQQFLKIWPNHLDVLYRSAYAEHKIGQDSIALELAKKLKKIEPPGLYNGLLVEMFVYLDNNDISKLEKNFNHLLLQPENLLALNNNTYRLMIFFTLASKNLSIHAPTLYEKYTKYHSYSCEVQNNIAIHYFNLEDFVNSAKHIKQTFNKDQECLNPELLRLLKERDLAA